MVPGFSPCSGWLGSRLAEPPRALTTGCSLRLDPSHPKCNSKSKGRLNRFELPRLLTHSPSHRCPMSRSNQAVADPESDFGSLDGELAEMAEATKVEPRPIDT